VKSLLRRRPSPAMVIALLALFVSLSGVSYGVATGFIDSREIKNNEVRSLDIRNNEVRSVDLRNNEVRGRDIRNSTVQSQDIAINAVKGVDVDEDTLGKVPSALLADTATTATTATRATTAGSVDDLKIINTTMQTGAPNVVLATNGPLTLLGRCINNAGDTSGGLLLDTSEDNTWVDAENAIGEPDLDATEMPWPIQGAIDPPGGDRSAALALFHANAPSGPGFTGEVSIQMNATSMTAGSCRFQGSVVAVG
jgi:hypothetical protein